MVNILAQAKTLLESEELRNLIMTVAMAVITYLAIVAKSALQKWMNSQNTSNTEKEAIQHLMDGVNKAQDEIVRPFKDAATTGSVPLPKDIIVKARDTAIKHAQEAAEGAAKDLLNNWAKPRLDALVTQIVSKMKK